MDKNFDLNRFITAQDRLGSYDKALEEVRKGRKTSHWIWYIFPQIAGLGHSSTSMHFGIKSLSEAKAYLENDILRTRLYEITSALLELNDSAQNIFGELDAMKVRSCMTLFDLVSPNDVFAKVLVKFYNGRKCNRTLSMVIDVSKFCAYYHGEEKCPQSYDHRIEGKLWLSESIVSEDIFINMIESAEDPNLEFVKLVVAMIQKWCPNEQDTILDFYFKNNKKYASVFGY